MAGVTEALWRGTQVQLALATAAHRVRRLLLAVVHRLLFRRFPASGPDAAPERILVSCVGNVGDTVVLLPTLHAIRHRFPHARLVLLTSPGVARGGAAELLAGSPLVDEVRVYQPEDARQGLRALVWLRELRAQRFQLFIRLTRPLTRARREFWHLLLARLLGCRYAVGFHLLPPRVFPRAQALYWPQQPEPERIYQSVARELSLGPPGPLRLELSADVRARVACLLEQLGLAPEQPFVVVHPGAKRSPNRWFADRFAVVADTLQTRYGLRVVLSGESSDATEVTQVAKLMKTTPVSLCGQTTLPELAALLERALLYVGNDTGPMHLAAAVGTPTVSIFSARDFPVRWFPYGDHHSVLRRDVPCSPCFKEVCDRDLVCQNLITVEAVLAAVELQLARVRQHKAPAGVGE